jgi:hypothetical protein
VSDFGWPCIFDTILIQVAQDWGGEALVAECEAVPRGAGGDGQFTEGHADGLRREGEGSNETTHGLASWQDLENALLGVQEDRIPLVEGRSAGVGGLLAVAAETGLSRKSLMLRHF